MSPGSSRTSSVAGPTWSSPVAGARSGAQTSAASPTSAGRGPVRSWRPARPSVARPAPRRRGARGRRRAAPGAARPSGRGARGSSAPPAGRRNSDAGSRIDLVDPPDRRWSVGSKRRRDSTSSPNSSIRIGQVRRRREDVDEAAAARELALAGDLEDRARSRGRGARRARRSWPTRLPGREPRGSAGRSSGGSVCWRSAWTLATRTRARPLRQARERRDARRRLVARRARSARRPARCAARGRRPRPGSPSHAASSSATRSPISASRAIQHEPLAGHERQGRGEVRLRTVRHGVRLDVPAAPTRRRRRRTAEALAQGRERPAAGEQRRQRGEVRDPAGPARLPLLAAVRLARGAAPSRGGLAASARSPVVRGTGGGRSGQRRRAGPCASRSGSGGCRCSSGGPSTSARRRGRAIRRRVAARTG